MTRWTTPVTLICCAIAGLLGGALGWSSTVPVYVAQAMLEFAPATPAIVFNTGDSMTPVSDARLVAEAAVIRHPRPHNHPALTALGLSHTELMAALTVRRLSRTQLLAVAFEHTDRGVPGPVVNAVIRAYEDGVREGGAAAAKRALAAVEARLRGALEEARSAATQGDGQAQQQQLERLRARREQLIAELAADPGSDRVQLRVVTYAETPSAPAHDRRTLFAAIGALLGGLLPAGGFWAQSRRTSTAWDDGA